MSKATEVTDEKGRKYTNGQEALQAIADEEGVTGPGEDTAERMFASGGEIEEGGERTTAYPAQPAPPATPSTPLNPHTARVDILGRTDAQRVAEEGKLLAKSRAAGRDPNEKVDTRGETTAERNARTQAAVTTAAEKGDDLNTPVDTQGRRLR